MHYPLINMKGVIFEQAGAEPKVTNRLEKPSPSTDQILVKSIYTAINPVYACHLLIIQYRD